MRYHEQTFPSVKHLEPQRIGGSYGKREAVMVGESRQRVVMEFKLTRES